MSNVVHLKPGAKPRAVASETAEKSGQAVPGQTAVVRLAPSRERARWRILHCLRAPVGGLFRHVRDLAREQAARGHDVAVLCDLNATDPLTEQRLAELAPHLSLGLHKVAMSREIGFSDLAAVRATRRIAGRLSIDVIHGHGAKGGAYARLATRGRGAGDAGLARFYTPHGGSLHYDPASLKGRLFMAAERRLLARTDGLIFESQYAAETFAAKVGQPPCPFRVIHNGVLPAELRTVEPDADAADFLFVGELRHLKGVDVLLDAMAILARQRPVSALIVGAGPDAAEFRQQADRLALAEVVRFAGAMPAREAFRLGRALVMPSRVESLPYVALEAAGAGMPLIASAVGGVPEIVDGTDTELVPPGDAGQLARAMATVLDSRLHAADRAGRLQRRVADRFSVARMTDGVLEFYSAARSPEHTLTQPAARAALAPTS